MPGRVGRPSTINPLLQSIREARGFKASGPNEVNVVSSSLCDDIINRLGPSLAPHKGCTVIDINPGPGVFSARLYEHLKPRSHILVEPIQQYHQPFLRPLVDAPNSRYHLRDFPFADSVDLSTYIKDGLLSQNGTKREDIAAGRNDSILVLANMARGRMTRDGIAGQLNSHYRILSFINALRHRAGLNAQGPVRILLWLADKDTNGLLPQTVTTRKKIALQLETYYHVEEIVGGGRQFQQKRDKELDLESGRLVSQRMQALGIQIPDHRKDDYQKEVEKSKDGVSQATSALSRNWEKELQRLEEEFKHGEFPQVVGGPPGPHTVRATRSGTLTPQFMRLRQLRSNARSDSTKQVTLEGLLHLEAKIDSLQTELLHASLDAAERKAKSSEQQCLRDDLKATLDAREPSFASKFAFLGDDRRAFALNPPLLMWDRRGAEPLVAQGNEFYQAHKLALLDFQPLLPQPSPLTTEETVYFDYFSTHLFYHGTQTIKSLNHIAPGAFEALAHQVPELQDPSKGGRYDLEELRARNLTPGMLYKFALLWQKWAFKPPISELADKDRFETKFRGGDDPSRFGGAFKPMRD